MLARIEVYGAQLDSLRNVNVLNDAFHIWHDHEFGTISNFRLGRLPSVQVHENLSQHSGHALQASLHGRGTWHRLVATYLTFPLHCTLPSVLLLLRVYSLPAGAPCAMGVCKIFLSHTETDLKIPSLFPVLPG